MIIDLTGAAGSQSVTFDTDQLNVPALEGFEDQSDF